VDVCRLLALEELYTSALRDFLLLPRLKKMVHELDLEYSNRIVPHLAKKFNYSNKHQIPKLVKISLNVGFGLRSQNSTFLKNSLLNLQLISSQKPVLTKARADNAGFKIKRKMILGAKITLRNANMFSFISTLLSEGLRKISDFKGFDSNKFDCQGNYNFSVSDLSIFPELRNTEVDSNGGCNVSIVTTAKSSEESRSLLEKLGFNFN
jgi:large subunit ribosomal protein L5